MKKLVVIALKWVPALIMLQTLFYKFSGAEESIFIFSALRVEPYGRYVVGVLELIASILLVLKKYDVYGGLLGVLLMSGALASHVLVLGIEVNNDGGLLFALALITFISCSFLVLIRRTDK